MINTDPSTDHTDNQLYIQRARTILHGKLLYKDVDTQTPPLINYLLVPPVYFGTSPLAFEIYFSFFIVLSTLAIFHFLSYMDERKAFFSALAFLFIPTTLVVSTFARQDEAIVVFFFLLPLLLLFTNKNRYRYTLFSSIGIWIKMHSIFLIPPVFLKIKGKEMMKHILIISTVSIVTALPFLILTFEQFTWHLKFYFLGRGGELEGISLWRILGSQGYTVPSIVLIGIMMIAFIFIYYLSYKKDFGIWKVVSLTLLLYFIIYPKIHYEYFLMLLAVLIPYLIENKKMIMLAYLISLLSGLTLLIEQRYLDWNVASIHSEIFISLAVIFMVAVDIFIIFIFRHIVTHKTWLDQKPLF
ncbi:MAG: hypothetical protein U9O96_00465 [Candidatus Thermoplasmatota archaeon]|nr:hypothetical protein [Candidatus Thermoplasmatota archaeon]